MTRALTMTIRILAVLLAAAPAGAQTVISNHPPLSPAEAVRVLRASHSPADRTDAPYVDLGGPRIVIFEGSTTPWGWPAETFAPIRPLADDYGYAPFWPYGSAFVGGRRFSQRVDGLAFAHPAREPRAVALAPQSPRAPRSIVMPGSAAGRALRR